MTDDRARFAPAFTENARTIARLDLPLTTPKNFTRALIADTAAAHGLTYDDLMSRNRSRRFVVARREAIRQVYEAHPDWGYSTIGRLFGFDHSTVMYHLDQTGGRAPRLHKVSAAMKLPHCLEPQCSAPDQVTARGADAQPLNGEDDYGKTISQ